MLAALSQVTSTAELGQLVTCSIYRNAGLLAKEAACIDVFSGGRLILGLGAGWYDREYAAYGYEYLPDRHAARGARGDDQRHPAAVVRGDGARSRASTSSSTARTATRSRSCAPAALGRRRRREDDPAHRGAARRRDQLAGRPRPVRAQVEGARGALRRGSGARLRLHRAHPRPRLPALRLPADLDAWLDSPGGGNLWGGRSARGYVRDNFVGTVDQVAEKVQGFVDAGCREFVLWFRDFPSTREPRAVHRRGRAADSSLIPPGTMLGR